jgi:proteasome lid subunit RPN8/RPN11
MLCLNKKELERLIGHSKRESPNEACGILAGFSKGDEGASHEVKKIYEMSNADKSESTFFMDPAEQLKAMKEIRNSGFEMVGIYHSHPHTGAYPSGRDAELAFYPEASYLIISLKDENDPELRSFRIIEGKITEEEVRVG